MYAFYSKQSIWLDICFGAVCFDDRPRHFSNMLLIQVQDSVAPDMQFYDLKLIQRHAHANFYSLTVEKD